MRASSASKWKLSDPQSPQDTRLSWWEMLILISPSTWYNLLSSPPTTSFYLENKTGSKQSFTLLADLLDKHTQTLTTTISHLMNGRWRCRTAWQEIWELLLLGFSLPWTWQQWATCDPLRLSACEVPKCTGAKSGLKYPGQGKPPPRDGACF